MWTVGKQVSKVQVLQVSVTELTSKCPRTGLLDVKAEEIELHPVILLGIAEYHDHQ